MIGPILLQSAWIVHSIPVKQMGRIIRSSGSFKFFNASHSSYSTRAKQFINLLSFLTYHYFCKMIMFKIFYCRSKVSHKFHRRMSVFNSVFDRLSKIYTECNLWVMGHPWRVTHRSIYRSFTRCQHLVPF